MKVDRQGRWGAWAGAGAMVLAAVLLAVPASAEAPVRTGKQVLGEWTDAVKTPQGKQKRRFRTTYDWDTGTSMRETFDLQGKRLSIQKINSAPSPSPVEIERAREIVLADVEVGEIARRQGGLQLDGGFTLTHAAGEGPCVAGTRCVQMFLFDGENVVRHMLVDLRLGRIVEPDYIPPRNRGSAK